MPNRLYLRRPKRLLLRVSGEPALNSTIFLHSCAKNIHLLKLKPLNYFSCGLF